MLLNELTRTDPISSLLSQVKILWHLALPIGGEFTYDHAIWVLDQLGGEIVTSNSQPNELSVVIAYPNRAERDEAKKKLRRLSRGKVKFTWGPGWVPA